MGTALVKHSFFHVSSELQVQENKKNEDTKKPTGAEPERERGKQALRKMGLSWRMFVPEAP